MYGVLDGTRTVRPRVRVVSSGSGCAGRPAGSALAQLTHSSIDATVLQDA